MYGGIYRHFDALPRRTRRLSQGLALALVLGTTAATAAATTATAATAAPTPTIYVSPSGDDAAAGTSTHPMRTINAAVRRTPDRGRVVVASGTYHESVAVQGHTGRSIVAARGATVWLDGSRPVTTWQRSGAAWVSPGWTAAFDASPTFTKGAPDNSNPAWRFVNAQHPMAAHPDQVWIDGTAQQQVGSLGQVRPGSFYVDYSAQKLYVGSDPTGRDVRASDLAKAISIQDPGTTISGINVRRYANPVPSMGAITVERPNVTVRDLHVDDNATTGLGIYSTDATVSHVTTNRNGMHGMMASHADGLRLSGSTLVGNNTENFNYAPSAGGFKIGRSKNVSIRSTTFSANRGTGLWLDESVYNFSIVASRSTGNLMHGVSLETSGTGRFVGNVIDGNAGDGVKINDTDNLQVWNNTFTGNGRSINIVQDARDLNASGTYRDRSLPLSFRNQHIVVRNNILAAQRSTANCMLCVEDYSQRFTAAQLDIRTDGNLYQRPGANRPQWVLVWSRGKGNPAVFTTITDARHSTGQEHRGRLTSSQVLTSHRTQTHAVARARAATAYPLPSWVAKTVGTRTGARSLGAWRR